MTEKFYTHRNILTLPVDINIAIRKKIFCDALNLKRFETTTEEVQKMLEDCILEFDIEQCFNRFSALKFESEYLKQIASETVFTNTNVLRFLILIDVLNNTKIDKCFQNLCEIIGSTDIDYSEFFYWFYRFSNGDYDINYEQKKSDRKVTFRHLPCVCVEMILEEFDFKERNRLRRVNSDFRWVIDNLRRSYYHLECFIDKSGIVIRFDEYDVLYCPFFEQKGSIDILNYKIPIVDEDSLADFSVAPCLDEDFNRRAFNDLCIWIGNPNLTWKHFFYGFSTLYEFTENLLAKIDKFAFKFKTEQLNLYGHGGNVVYRFLKFMTPGLLESIEIYEFNMKGLLDFGDFEKFADLDSFKMAKHFKCDFSFDWNIDWFLHFESFEVKVQELSVDDLEKLRENIFNKPMNFKSCNVSFKNVLPYKSIAETFGINPDVAMVTQMYDDKIYKISDERINLTVHINMYEYWQETGICGWFHLSVKF